MKKVMLLLLLIGPALSIVAGAQNVTGLWLVKKVQVGEEEMTPTAKWFQLYETGLLRAGNGGNTNLTGSWLLDRKSLLMFDKNGKPDEAGAFETTVTEEKRMTWTRIEEDQKVVVQLLKIEPQDWPSAPWDKIQGNWKIRTSEGMELLPSSLVFESLYFRWDQMVNINFGTPQPNRRSIWRIPAHQSILQLIPIDESLPRSTWQIEFINNHMTWTQIVDGQTIRIEWEQLP